jgi:hypothetical protein
VAKRTVTRCQTGGLGHGENVLRTWLINRHCFG